MTCKYCGVLPEYGHMEWCKVDRAPTVDEIIDQVLEEGNMRVGGEGASSTLMGMCGAYIKGKGE